MKHTCVIAILTLASCGAGKNPAEQSKTATTVSTVVTLTKTQQKNAGLATGFAGREKTRSTIKASGRIVVPPQNMISVVFPFGGTVKSTSLLPGMYVRRGQVLAVMEDPQYVDLQQDYLTAKARQDFLESEYLRQKTLNLSRAASDKTYQRAVAEYRTNKILISALRQKLLLIGVDPESLRDNGISRSVNIYAPANGYVTEVNVNSGKYAGPSDVLFELVRPGDVHLLVTVFEKNMNMLQGNQKLFAYTNNEPERKYPCTIMVIGKDVGADRSLEVQCKFDQYDRSLLAGMYMNVDIEAEGNNDYVLPEDAVVRYDNKHYLFIVAGKDRFEMKEVRTGTSAGGMISIIDPGGIDLSRQEVVTKNAYSLLMTLKNTSE